MGNVLAAHMKANTTGTNKDNVDYDWNNGTLLGELIEKALIKNNTVLVKKACCLGMVHDGVRDETQNLPRINVPIANIGRNTFKNSAKENNLLKRNNKGVVTVPEFNKNDTGVPDADGNFTKIHDHITLFDELPEKDSRNFHVKPRNSEWYKSSNTDMKEIFNSRGMVTKKLYLRKNAGKGEKLLNPESCKLRPESWETIQNNNVQNYLPYLGRGLGLKSYDETNTEACDAFFGYYSKNNAKERECVTTITENGKTKNIINRDKPGCNTFIKSGDTDYAGYKRENDNFFNPMFSYPYESACLKAPYGSIYTDTQNGENKYSESYLFNLDPVSANPIGTDKFCQDMTSAPSLGESYALLQYRTQANKPLCINKIEFNDVEAEEINIQGVNMENNCGVKEDNSELPTDAREGEPNETTPTDDIIENQNKAASDNSNRRQAAQAAKNNEAKESRQNNIAEDSVSNQFSDLNQLYLIGGGAFFIICCILIMFIVMNR